MKNIKLGYRWKIFGLIVFLLLLPSISQVITVSNTKITGDMVKLDSETVTNHIDDIKLETDQIRAKTISPNNTWPEATVEVLQFSDHEMSLYGYGNDTLRFSMQFKPKKSARYYGRAFLYASNGTLIEESQYWDQDVTANVITVALFDINAYTISKLGIDGPYDICLEFTKDNGTSYSIYSHEMVHATDPYLASDFAKDPVVVTSVTPIFIDDDSNAKYEFIDLQINIDVHTPGSYRFYGYVRSVNYSYSDYNSYYADLTTGSQTVKLRFVGWKFVEMQFADKFKFELNIKHNIYPEYHFYSNLNILTTSNTYVGTNFDDKPFQLTGRTWFQPIDENNNGLYDDFQAIVELDIVRIDTGSFYAYLGLYLNTSRTYIGQEYLEESNIELNSIRTINMTFTFPGVKIYQDLQHYYNDSLVVKNLYGYYRHADGHYDSDYYNFGSYEQWTLYIYKYNEFESPGGSFTDNFVDYAEDTDNDSLYNQIVVEVEVSITKAGEYRISSGLRAVSSNTFAYDSVYATLDVGTHWMILVFDTLTFYRKGINDTLVLSYVDLYDQTIGAQLDHNSSIYLSHYNFVDFDPPKAKFTGIYSDQTYDANSDGLWDELRIYIEVEINETGYYRLEGNLKNPITTKTYYFRSGAQHIVTTGTFSLLMTIPGEWIWTQGTNTTYQLTSIRIIETNEVNDYIKEWDYKSNPFTTDAIYNSNDFNAPPAFFTGNFLERIEDSDGDLKIDFLIISAEVQVSESVNLDMEADMFVNNTWIYSHNQSTINAPGTYWIDLRYPGIRIYQYKPINMEFEVNFYLQNSSSGFQLDYCEYITTTYNYTSFEQPSGSLSAVYDYGVDDDANGRFDYIEIAFEVNVIESAEFYIHYVIYSEEGGNNIYRNTPYTTLGVGLHNITVKIDASWFLAKNNGTQVYIHYYNLIQVVEDYGTVNVQRIEESFYLNLYYYHNFDEPALKLIKVYDRGFDNNSNGLFDYVELIVEVKVQEIGEYNVYGSVRDSGTGDSFHFSTGFKDFMIGTYNFTFYLPPYFIRDHNGTSFYYSYIYGETYTGTEYKTVFGIDDDIYLNHTYYYHDFDAPLVQILNISSQPLDLDGDGKYDLYGVVYELNVTETLDIYFDMNLEDSNYDYIRGRARYFYDLTPGVHSVTIYFSGTYLYSSEFIGGIYVSYINIERVLPGNWEIIDRQWDHYELDTSLEYTDFTTTSLTMELKDYSFSVDETGNIKVQAIVKKYTNEGIQSVQLIINDAFYYELYWDDEFNSVVYFSRSFYFTETLQSLKITVAGYGGTFIEVVIPYSTPSFVSFDTVFGSTSIYIDQSLIFEAVVYDEDGIANVSLAIENVETGVTQYYLMTFVGNVTGGEAWQGIITFNASGMFDVTAIATDVIGISYESNFIAISVDEGLPRFYSFSLNISSTIVGGTILFEAVVIDNDGIDYVELAVAGRTYNMTYVQNKTINSLLYEIWQVAITFDQVGQFTARAMVFDITHRSTQSQIKNVYVNELIPEILSVDVSPDTRILVGQEITFTIVIAKSDSIITSVTLVFGEDTLALEMIDSDATSETYSVSFTPTEVGTYEAQLRVMNTRNQVAIHEETITVYREVDSSSPVFSPGFELLTLFAIPILLIPLRRKRRE